jgi:hypothetical protein
LCSFAALEQVPDARIGVQVRCVAGQSLHLQSLGGPGGEEVLHRLAVVDRRAVPDHEQLPAHLTEPLAEERDDRVWPRGA